MAPPIRAVKQRDYPMPVSEAWRLLADTDHLNRCIGLPSVEFSPLDGSTGELVRRARARRWGVVPLRWREYPFCWVRERRYSVRREFEWGPVAVLEGGVEMEPCTAGTRVNVYADFLPANVTGNVLWRLGAGIVDDTLDFCDHYLNRKQQGYVDALPMPGSPVVDRQRLAQAVARLAGRPVDKELMALLQERVLHGSDDQVVRLRAFSVAADWKANREDMLRLFLYAAKAGLLDLSWQLMCPNCRVPKAQAPSLCELPPRFHCDVCGIVYDTALDQRVELRFSVSPHVRHAGEAIYCIGGPLRMPHLVAQQYLRQGEAATLACPPMDQAIRLRAVGSNASLVLKPAPAGRTNREVSLIYAAGKWTGPLNLMSPDHEELSVPAGSSLALRNQTAGALLMVLEDIRWTDEALTACQALQVPEFRALFPSERPTMAAERA
jgi:rubredoxin